MQNSTGDQNGEKETKRKYSVSANRGSARHQVRYVETGGALVDTEDCVFCANTPEPVRRGDLPGITDA